MTNKEAVVWILEHHVVYPEDNQDALAMRKAVEALEREPEDGGCEICRCALPYDQLWRSVDSRGERSFSVKWKYCPVCGRLLPDAKKE